MGPTPANHFQIVDPHCCNTFDGSSVEVDLIQEVDEHAGKTASQLATNEAHCHVFPQIAGLCKITELINQNGVISPNTCSAPMCDLGQQCTDRGCVIGSCNVESCSFGGGLGPVAARLAHRVVASRLLAARSAAPRLEALRSSLDT